MNASPAAAPVFASSWLDDTRAVIEVSGEVDLYAAARLHDVLMDVHRAGRNLVIADFTNVEFMDSSGLGVLVGGIKRARSADGVLVSVGVPERILRVLRITGLANIMPCFATMPEAFAFLEARA